jgi:GxxExxY protein
MLDDKATTERIIGCAFKVHGQLGMGFLEKVYENAMMIELAKAGLHAAQQVPISVRYDGVVVGSYFADLLVEGRIVCEVKATEALNDAHEVQLVNYLIATDHDVGLLIHFGKSVTVRRKYRIYANTSPADSRNPVNPENPVNPV